MAENLIIENNILIKADAEIEEIIIPDNIIEIKSEAFLNCSKLQSVSIPETVKCIGKGAFKGCTALKYIQIPFVGKSISRVNNTHFGYIFGADSYKDNSKFVPVSLAEVKVLGGESIGKNAFYDCLWLQNITIGKNVTNITPEAFKGCTGILKLKVDEGNPVYNSIYNDANSSNAIIETASKTLIKGSNQTMIPDDLKAIGMCAFSDCSTLSTIVIPNSVKRIGKYAFENCKALSSVTLPDELKEISERTFNNCISLSTIAIPNSIVMIGDAAFYGCNKLSAVTINNKSTLETIEDRAFEGCTGLIGINLPEGLKTIHSYAFSGCKNLSWVTFPESLVAIKAYAFKNCEKLQWKNTAKDAFELPNNAYIIENAAFCGCKALANISVPAALLNINKYVFADCSGIQAIELHETENLDTGVNHIGLKAFNNCGAVTTLSLPNTLEDTELGAFEGLSKLEEIRIPFIGDSKRRPKNKYFGHIFGDSSLEDNGKNVPSTLTNVIVGSGAEVYDESFKNCTGIETIELQDKIHHIGKKAFSGCLSLKNISIPDDINTMDEAPFEGCPNLEYTTYDNGKYLGNSVHPHLVLSKATSTDIESHSLQADTKIIEAKAFKDCNKLTTFDIHNKVTNIGKEAFYGCEKLTVYSEALYRPTTWNQDWDIIKEEIKKDEKDNEIIEITRLNTVWDFKTERDASSGYITMTLRNGKKLVIKKCKVWGGSQSGSADGYYPGFGWAFSADFDLHTICNDRHWSTNEIHEDILASDDPLNSKEVEVYDYNYYEDKVLTDPDSYLHDNEVNLIRSQHSPVAILKLTKDADSKEFWKLIEE